MANEQRDQGNRGQSGTQTNPSQNRDRNRDEDLDQEEANRKDQGMGTNKPGQSGQSGQQGQRQGGQGGSQQGRDNYGQK